LWWILYLKTGGQTFLAPDNGVLTGLLDEPESLRIVNNRALFLEEVSSTFHGRDIFAPIAAEICLGLEEEELGPEVDDPITIQWSEPAFNGEILEGCIIYIDVFGNLVTNINTAHIAKLGVKDPRVFLCGQEIGVPQPAFSFKPKGESLAVFGSSGYLEIAVNEGNAAQTYHVGTGDEVIVTP